MDLDKIIDKVLVSEEEIAQIAKDMGAQISKDYKGDKPLILGLLKGCVPYIGDLLKRITIECEIDFMDVSSYHGGVESMGTVTIKKDLTANVKGRRIIIAEDIVDTGRTIKMVEELLYDRGAKSVEVATLLDKPEGRKVKLEAKYVGKTIPKAFVVGYGLDYDELYRNLPFVGILKKEVYTKK